MNFNEQSIEMKRTLLEASVGKVSIAAHGLEYNLLVFYCIYTTNDDVEFEKEHNRFRTLGQLINDIRKLDVFDDESLKVLIKAKEYRNAFTHRLSEKYNASILGNGSMLQLIQEFMDILKVIEKADHIVEKELQKLISSGVDVSAIKVKAKSAVQEWENT